MNKLKYFFISILTLIILTPGVKAEVIYTVDEVDLSQYETAINSAYDYINTNNYKYYIMYLLSPPEYENSAAVWIVAFNELPSKMSLSVSTENILYYFDSEVTILNANKNGSLTNSSTSSYDNSYLFSTSTTSETYYHLYDTNISIINTSGFTITFDGLFDTTVSVDNGKEFPTLKNGLIVTDNLTEVNLDNYHYVLLSLKDYSQSKAFDTNLKVKGMIGITPIYNFGTAEKTTITDRCNISYSDYTDYRLYVLKDDLINNAIYAVKSCEEASSFKFDNSIFNITYITDDNVDDPVVVVDGQEYHTIPFDDLSNSANKNEENNFIPGESNNSFTDIIDNAISFTSDIWNAFLSFMSLGTKFFNALPPEFRALSITGFTVLITIAVIKFLKS